MKINIYITIIYDLFKKIKILMQNFIHFVQLYKMNMHFLCKKAALFCHFFVFSSWRLLFSVLQKKGRGVTFLVVPLPCLLRGGFSPLLYYFLRFLLPFAYVGATFLGSVFLKRPTTHSVKRSIKPMRRRANQPKVRGHTEPAKPTITKYLTMRS